MNAGKHLHHIADDHQRAALVHFAVRKGMEQARVDFMYALSVDGADNESLTPMACAAWEAFSCTVEFDYPQYAQTLFLHGLRSGYQTHLINVAAGRHESAHDLVAAIEKQMGLSES